MTLTGLETLDVNGVLGNGYPAGRTFQTTTRDIANLGIGSDPVINTSFTNAVANLTLAASYAFGSGAAAPSGGSAIRNATDLAQYFDPLNINAQSVKINSELQTYNTSFSGGNHVFATDNLALTGTLGSGTTNVTVYGNLGNNSGFSTLSFDIFATLGIHGTAISVGQLLVLTYFGMWSVSSISTDTVVCKALFGSGTSISAGLFTPWAFLPSYYKETNALTAAGNAVLHFAATPPDVVTAVGAGSTYYVGFYDNTGNTSGFSSNMNATKLYSVIAADSTTVTLNTPLVGTDAVANGQGIFFTPPILSAEMWLKHQYPVPGQGVNYFASEAEILLPQNAVKYALSGSVSGAAANGAYGGWPAYWMFGGAGSGFGNAAEVDFGEWYNTITRDMHSWDPNLHQGDATAIPVAQSNITPFLFNPSLWTYLGGLYTYISATDLSSSYIKVGILVTSDSVMWFLNGQMMRKSYYNWTSQRVPQIGINLAIGSFAPGLGSNMLFPLADTNFPSMNLKIKSLKVWNG